MSRAKARRGFTLIELIVVLMILVGLAGMVIPAVTDMVVRTHAATGSGNLAEVANAVQRYEVQYLDYPNNLDSARNAALDAGADWDQAPAALGTEVTLDANTLLALQNAGITSVITHADASDSATFNQGAVTALTATSVLLGLSPAQQVAMGLETTGVAGKYVVLGVGSQSELIGKTMTEAPVHFPESGAEDPNTSYQRFFAVFQITDGTDALERARFATVVGPEGSGIGAHMGEYFEAVNEESN